ncbi:M1 family metallopeptidase [Streptomyces sp. NPDC006627]|uniref:M1 family metallopeptidase n=1 Tax=Streptomyces sp. NPDC006627 TaxID=3154679 RepID=UPI0033A74835
MDLRSPAARAATVPRTLACALALLVAVSGCAGSGVDGTPGADGVRDPYFPKLGNGGYDVTHYGLTLGYDPDGRHLTGTAEITARAAKNLSSFNLDLKGLDVSAVTVEGKAARFQRAGQELRVRPADELDRGETFVATVRYSGTPETITDADGSEEGWLKTADGALALGQPAGSMAWFPGNHHPSDKASYDIAITVPKGLTAVSNGELTRESTKNGRTTFAWHSAEPMASYLATVAVGEYEMKTTATEDGLPVVTAVDPSQAKAGKKALAKIPDILEWAEYNFGPYPFSSAGAIVDREEDAAYALETQTRPVFPGPPETGLIVHEMAHQWFGDSVTPRSWRDMWLNEGFATYAEWLYEEDQGGDSAQDTFDALYEGDYYEDAEDNEAIWDFPPAKPTDAAHISDAPVYERGAMVIHKIRRAVGDDAFYDIVQGWAKTYRHKNADTRDFTEYVEKHAGSDEAREKVGRIWGDWLYGDGKPDRP